MKRTFAAIKVVPDENLLKIYRELKSALAFNSINWVAEQNLHITLKFFGDTTDRQIYEICSLFAKIAQNHSPFQFTLKGTGIFGSRYAPRVIWLGMENGQSLEKLGLEILQNVETIGFERDRQNFRPHLTIGRIKNVKDKKMFQKVLDGFSNSYIQEVAVEEFYLIESKLRPQGPIYEVIETFRL